MEVSVMKKTLVLVLAFMMVLTSGVALAAADYPWLDDSIIESSTLPTWEGKQLLLNYWNSHGVDPMPDEVSPKDVVSPEVARVTGVTLDYENSFTNGAGVDFGARLPIIAASGDWPSIIYAGGANKTMMESGVVYDLTDYITEEYLPSIFKRSPKDDPLYALAWKDPYIMLDGRYYAVPNDIGANYMLVKDRIPFESAADRAKYEGAFARPENYRPAAYVVRDDVTKALFPESKTMDEIEALYMEKGYFEYDDVFDIPIKSPEDFYQFLRDIDALGLEENGQKVYATFTGACFDSYLMGARLANGLFGYGSARDPWTYWDNVEQKILYSGFEADQRSLFREFNKLIRDDVVSPESLIEDTTMHAEKMNNGLYAFAFAEWAWPNNELIEARKDYRYRPIFFDIPIDRARYAQTVASPTARGAMIFKDKVPEEDLPQIMAWFDFQFSVAHDYLMNWGPETAGLFITKENGKREFVDPALADAILYNNNVALTQEYNLRNGFWNVNYRVRRWQFGGSIMEPLSRPYMHYEDIARDPGTARDLFKSGLVESYDVVVSQLGWVWNFNNVNEDVKSFFEDNRKMVEDLMMRSLGAMTDEEFEARFDEYVNFTKSVGATDETMAAITEYFIDVYNVDFMENLLGANK